MELGQCEGAMVVEKYHGNEIYTIEKVLLKLEIRVHTIEKGCLLKKCC